jgi:hypothetical protein
MIVIREPNPERFLKIVMDNISILGECKNLSYGKLRGFRLRFNKDKRLHDLKQTLSKFNIQIQSYTHHVSPTKQYVNVHSFLVPENSEFVKRYFQEHVEQTSLPLFEKQVDFTQNPQTKILRFGNRQRQA